MVYEVTCSACGTRYRVTSPGGETRRVACPSCGRRQTVSFPAQKQPQKKSSELRKALWAMLAVLVIGLPAGGYGWYVYDQHQRDERQAFEQRRAARRAHVDSLNRMRALQEKRELDELRQKAQDERVARFLTRFYDETYFGSESPDTWRESLTERCYRKLLTDGGDATADRLAWQRLQPSIPDADRRELHDNLRVQPRENGWYGVVFRARGMTQTRLVRVVASGGLLLIDDYQ